MVDMTVVAVTELCYLHHDDDNSDAGDVGVSADSLTYFIFVASSDDVGVLTLSNENTPEVSETGCLVTTEYLLSFLCIVLSE